MIQRQAFFHKADGVSKLPYRTVGRDFLVVFIPSPPDLEHELAT